MAEFLDFKDASHRLRISPELLKWCCSHSPKSDGRKLQQAGADTFCPQELQAFDDYLRGPWPTRTVPQGIVRELRVEARGRCGVCDEPCEKPQAAHIRRKGVEVAFYVQHPENLILLCGNCHARYDDPKLKQIDLGVVEHAKARLVSRKMEAIDRDVANVRAIREAVEYFKATCRTELMQLGADPTNPAIWANGAGEILPAIQLRLGVPPGGSAAHLDERAPSASLNALSGATSPTQHMTRALLDVYALEAAGEVDDVPSDWELVEERPAEEYECIICGCLKDYVEYHCQDCGHYGSNTDQPDKMEENAFGVLLPIFSDDKGDSYPLECEECESQNLQTSYWDSMCSSCEHRFANDD